MYTGHCREPTIILEAVASQDLWIWHAFFGMPGSLNDINALLLLSVRRTSKKYYELIPLL
jgi:hypothetical protein